MLQDFEIWFSIVADGVTILGVISVIVAIIKFSKNQVSARTIKVNLSGIVGVQNEDCKFLLRLENYTDKTFYITQIKLTCLNRSYPAKTLREYPPKIYYLVDISPIRVSAFECIDLTPIFELNRTFIQPNAKLIIHTTVKGKMVYSLSKICASGDN